MKFIGLLILSALWLGFTYMDPGNTPEDFMALGFIPVLYGWSVFLMLTALISGKSQKI